MLRKSIIISLVTLFLSANTEMVQLLKIPNLIDHLLEHENQQDPEHAISFLEFIKMHYAEQEHHHKKDDKEHQGLPFKTLNHNANTILAFQKMQIFAFAKNVIIPKNSPGVFYPQLYNSGVYNNIWLPPKLS